MFTRNYFGAHYYARRYFPANTGGGGGASFIQSIGIYIGMRISL